MSSREPTAEFSEVYDMVRRVVEARGVRQPGEPEVRYEAGGLSLSRTPLNEYEVRTEAGVVFRVRHTGALSSAHIYEEGDWVEEVRRIDREVRRGKSK